MNLNIVTSDGIKLYGNIHSFIANNVSMKFDVMVDGRYYCKLVFPCEVGSEYTYDELMAFCKLKNPSLCNKNFELLPSGKPKFRN